jgi:hypothetical protein
VSVYIIRVHCPLHHTLDTFYGLFAKELKLHKSKIQKTPKYLHSNFFVWKFKVLKRIWRDEEVGWRNACNTHGTRGRNVSRERWKMMGLWTKKNGMER